MGCFILRLIEEEISVVVDGHVRRFIKILGGKRAPLRSASPAANAIKLNDLKTMKIRHFLGGRVIKERW